MLSEQADFLSIDWGRKMWGGGPSASQAPRWSFMLLGTESAVLVSEA